MYSFGTINKNNFCPYLVEKTNSLGIILVRITKYIKYYSNIHLTL